MYQIQGLETSEAVETLARSAYDLVVVEPTFTLREDSDFDAKGMVSRLHAGRPGRIVLAYIDIGEAERYRAYWQTDWTPPAKGRKGHPDFLLFADPDGWNDSYVVAYWRPAWQQVMLADVRRIMAAGFDGVYLDWVSAYEEETVVAEAKRENADPAKAMVAFIGAVRQAARQANPSALVVAQNAAYLVDRDPAYLGTIDAIAFEDTWFAGKANAGWNSPGGGDVPNRYKDESSTEALLKQYAKYVAAGKPVFTVDYCLRPQNAAKVYEAARQAGLVPLVTRVSLERITTTPPPGLEKR
jgi:cysteinyl-tRNA synthetase